MNKLAIFTATLGSLVVLSSCGGGGGSSSSNTSTLGGVAVDGILQTSTVCIDLNNNGICESGIEPKTTTDSDGKYSLTLTEAHKNYNDGTNTFATAQIVVYGGKDKSTGKDFGGKLRAANSGTTINVTPATTLVAKTVSANTATNVTTAEKIASAKEKAAKVLNIDIAKVDANPIEDSELAGKVVELQKTIEVFQTALQSNGSSKASNELADDVYEAFAISVENLEIKDITLSGSTETTAIDTILTQMVQDQGSATVEMQILPPKVLAVKDSADKMRKKFAEMATKAQENSMSVDKMLELVEKQAEMDNKRFEKEFKAFVFDESGEVGTTTFDIGSEIDFDLSDDTEFFTETFNIDSHFVKEEIKLEFGFTNTTTIDGIFNAIGGTNSATIDEIYNDDFLEKIIGENSQTAFVDELSKIREDIAKDKFKEEQQQRQEEAENGEGKEIQISFDAYNLVSYDNDSSASSKTLVIEKKYFDLASSKLVCSNEAYTNSNWGSVTNPISGTKYSSNDYLLTSDGFVDYASYRCGTSVGGTDISLTNNQAGIVVDKWKLKYEVVDEVDVSNTSPYFDGMPKPVKMLDGAMESIVATTATEDRAKFSSQKTGYTSLADFFAAKCSTAPSGVNDSRLNRFDDHYGMAFKANSSDVCSLGANTSGAVVEVFHSGTATVDLGREVGTWHKITLHNKEVIVINPSVDKYKRKSHKLRAFTVINHDGSDVVYRGEFYPATSNTQFTPFKEFKSYFNAEAMRQVKLAIEGKEVTILPVQNEISKAKAIVNNIRKLTTSIDSLQSPAKQFESNLTIANNMLDSNLQTLSSDLSKVIDKVSSSNLNVGENKLSIDGTTITVTINDSNGLSINAVAVLGSSNINLTLASSQLTLADIKATPNRNFSNVILNITGVATNGDAKITINNGMLSLSIDSFNPTSLEGDPNLTSIVFNFPSVKIENTASQTSFVGNISVEALQRTTMQVSVASYNTCLNSQTIDNGAYQDSYNYMDYTGDELAAFTAAFTVGYNAGYADGLQDKYNYNWDTSNATKTGTSEGYWRGQNEGQDDRRNCADINEDLNLKSIALSGEFSNASNTFTMGVNATMDNYDTFVSGSETAVALGSMKITMDANLNGMPNAKSTLDVVMTGDKKGNATWTLEQEGKGSMIISTKGDASSTTSDEISVKDSNGAEIIIQETDSNGKVLVDGKEVGVIRDSKITYSDGSFESFK